MSLVNAYKTPLTSTKSKFLEEDECLKFLIKEKSLKRKLICELLSSQKCSTENRFLQDVLFLKEPVDEPIKKKKKKMKAKQRFRCAYRLSAPPTGYSQDVLHDFDDSDRERERSVSYDPTEPSYAPAEPSYAPCALPESNSGASLFGSKDLRSLAMKLRSSDSSRRNSSSDVLFSMASDSQPCDVFDSAPTFGAPRAAVARCGKVMTLGAPLASFKVSTLDDRSDAHLASLADFRFGGVTAPVRLADTVIMQMPSYKLDVIEFHKETEVEFLSFCSDESIYSCENSLSNKNRKKMQLLNVISLALMFSSNLKDKNDCYRISLKKSLDEVRLIEPEFILKVALYARQELHIRTVTNFILSYAAFHQNTRIYLEKYFDAAIVLPTDWIEVAEFYQVITEGNQKQSLPAALRRVMRKSFPKFDKYQLAKYNRDKAKKKKKDDDKASEKEDEKDEEKNETDACSEDMEVDSVKPFTLKRLIQSLHIDSPAEHVMCLLGKKYPKTYEEFTSSGLQGTWDPKKAATRMKLPVPETWETEISAHGNKPNVWESLIDNKKLPYMAMLRNLKNLIVSGISSTHHEKIINNIENKKSVINSRQLPMQFFEAYKAITNIEKLAKAEELTFEKPISQSTPFWKKAQFKKIKSRIDNISVPVLEQYKNAISKALEISSLNNLNPIPGKTLVICEIIPKTFYSKEKFKSYETCILLGLMCLKACEDCKMIIIGGSDIPDAITLKEDELFLDTVMTIYEKYEELLTDPMNLLNENINMHISALQSALDSYLKPQAILSLKLDHVVFLQNSAECEAIMSSFLHKYRQLVNSELLYTNVNFNLSRKSFSEQCATDKDVYLCGSTSSLIKFIAERSTGGQLSFVENIDMKYTLPEISVSKYKPVSVEITNEDTSVPINYRMPKWHTIRVFISSTFKDMASERDLLIKYVFPELKRRAASVFIRIVEIDLRWGITESDSSTKRAAELCLTEAQKADLFVGIIGERYGSVYSFDPPDDPDLCWVKDCPPGSSITELEIHAAALHNSRKASQGKAFFYFRNSNFIRQVPQKWENYFMSENMESKMRVDGLKNKIRGKNFKILDGYPCQFAGVYENKPIISGLDVLGNRVLEDLWKAVQDIHKNDPHTDNLCEEEMHQQNLLESKSFFEYQKNSCMESVIKKITSEEGIFVICGVAGCGKTHFLINLLNNLKNFTIVKFFIGISPRSRDLPYIIKYICRSICQQLGISVPLPDLPIDLVNGFPDFLLEATKCSGGKEIILLIDGLDYLGNDDQTLDWLPLSLPNKMKLICSTSDSSHAFKVLCERQTHGNAVSIHELPSLLQSEREQFIRNYLNYYKKALDESALSNNMLKVVTKKDSCNPFYLRIICDFLRLYATFENLVTMLQKLPSSTMLLFQEIILQLENEFGSRLVQTILTLLCITNEGLEDIDLHYISSFLYADELKILSNFDELKKKIMSLPPENLISQVEYCSLIHIISTFAYGNLRQKSMSLVGTEFERAVKKFYSNKNFASHSKNIHCVLAGYYHNICDINNDRKYKGKSGFAVRNLLYHMFYGCLYKELSDILCNHAFIETVFATNSDENLLEYYSLLLYEVLPSNQKLSKEIDHFHLFSFYEFVSRNFHIFHQYPQLVMQQALNEPSDSSAIVKNDDWNHCSLENLSRTDAMDYRLATLCGFVKNITASAGEKDKPIAVLGSEDGYIKILDLSTRRVIRTIKAHASAITCICFAGKNHMCVSSVDGTLSLWNTDDFSRVFVLKGHKYNVTSCCSDPAGIVLYSSGWDNAVRLWSLSDGRQISVIENFRCPVNCVDHHPTKQLIACGLWNGNIEIWDTVSMQKNYVFSKYSGSVKSLAYTLDGINIVSSYFQSEISVWSSEEGRKISSLKGHILPVKALSYSLDGRILVSGSDDCTLKVWSSVHQSHFASLTEAKFCPVSLMEFISENLLVVAFQNAEIWVIDINNGKVSSKFGLESDAVSVFSKHSLVNRKCIKFEENWSEKLLVFGTQTGKLMTKDLLSLSLSKVFELNSKITALIHNSEIIVCGTAGGDIGVFSYPENELSKIIFTAHKGFIGTFSLINQYEKLYLLSTANDNVLKIWNIDWDNSDLTLQEQFLNKHRDTITYSLFHPSSSDSSVLNYLFTGSHDNNIISWSTDSVKVFQGLQSSVVKIACSGDYVIGCGNDGALVMWLKNGTVLTSLPRIEQSSTNLTFYVGEDYSDKFAVLLAYVDLDGSIKINKPLQQTHCCSFDAHSKPITSCCITENGEVISCSLDGSVNLWKLPFDITDKHAMHTSVITGLLLSSSAEFALSSDALGNLILWKVHLNSATSPLEYSGKKSYNGGFIRSLSWLKNNNFVCAVTQVIGDKEIYFLNIIELKSDSEATAFKLQVKKSYNFESEVLCLDSCDTTDIIIVGLKSGDVVCITSEAHRLINMCTDWLLGLCLFSRKNTSDLFCVSYVDGCVKLFSVDSFLNDESELLEPFGVYKPSETYQGSRFTSAMCSGKDKLVCCGDSDGILRIYIGHSLKFVKKVHDDAITGTCIVGSYLFTSSLDKTVKGWSVKSFSQVCQFYSHVPISCLSTVESELKKTAQNYYLLLIGTTSGNVHLLKFHYK